jgi:cytochrome c oxidase subunit II
VFGRQLHNQGWAEAMKQASIWMLFCLFLTAPLSAFADDPVVPAEEYVHCTVCHGVQLMGNEVLYAPRLSGLDSWYVERQLMAFKNGWRGTHDGDVIGREMQPMAAALTAGQVVEVAEFVAATRSDPPVPTLDGDADHGAPIYASCAACHGPAGEGNAELGGPALAAMNDWYLVAQLENYRDGMRGTHPEDIYGQQMAAAMQMLQDDEAIANVVAYITTLGR